MTAPTAREALERLATVVADDGESLLPYYDVSTADTDVATLLALIDVAEAIEANISWHTDSHGKRMGGYQFTLDGDYLIALAAALRGEAT